MSSGCFSYSYQIGAILKLDCEFQILSRDTKMRRQYWEGGGGGGKEVCVFHLPLIFGLTEYEYAVPLLILLQILTIFLFGIPPYLF